MKPDAKPRRQPLDGNAIPPNRRTLYGKCRDGQLRKVSKDGIIKQHPHGPKGNPYQCRESRPRTVYVAIKTRK